MKMIFATLFAILIASPALAQPKPAQKKPAPAPAVAKATPAETAIRQASNAYVAALNAGDFKAAASFWTPDGEFVDPSGQVVKVGKITGEQLAKRFSGAGKPQFNIRNQSVRMVTPDTGVEDGWTELRTAVGAPATQARYSAIWVQQQGKWRIHSLRETRPESRTHQHSLKELAWLVGSWVAQAEGDTIRIQSDWDPGKAWIVREISVERDGAVKQRITQRIGQDPLGPKIKSWAFEADGGLAEAFWEKDGDSWHVNSRGATRNGKSTSAKNAYSNISATGFTLNSDEARVGNDDAPAFKLQFKSAGASKPAELAATASNSTNDAARERILNSPEWRETQRAYHEWLSVQKIYTPAEVQKLRSEFAAKIGKMSAAQLQNFLEDAREKVAILLSKPAEDARLWLAQRMAVEVNLTPQQLKEMRPDIANMTAAQVEQRLQQLQQERRQTQQAQQSFDAGRQAQIQNIQRQEQQSEQEREAALNRAYESVDSPGGYYYGGAGAGLGRAAYHGWGYRY